MDIMQESPIVEYYDWLLTFVSFGNRVEDYAEELRIRSILLNQLYNKKFVFLCGTDKNRFMDGQDLRMEFMERNGYHDEDFELIPQCSILEALVAFAKRMDDDIMYDPRLGNRSGDWFMIMLNNLALWGLVDDEYGSSWTSETVDGIIDIFLYRKYDKNGNGSLFPVKELNGDMRFIDMWCQMSLYITKTLEAFLDSEDDVHE